jgi:3',5'-cyclic AMP phosphodiesterase CpdA
MDKEFGTKRRNFIKGISLVGFGSLLGGSMAAQELKNVKAKKVLRIANITDVHLNAENNAPQRFSKCLNEIKNQQVDFFLNGGDSIMAADYDHINREQVTEMWNLWKNSLKNISDYEIYSCLGNHDMWWAAPNRNDPMYGKPFAMDQLNMPAPFYSFNKADWHFIVLDSNCDGGGNLGEEQIQWLSADLKKTPHSTPVLVMSHYPILSACTHTVGGNHKDSLSITKIFYQHRHKKIHCISGHVHLLDRSIYNNVHYYCNGAVSGFWWSEGDDKSAEKYWYHETPPGYAILDLYEDGSLISNYYTYTI